MWGTLIGVLTCAVVGADGDDPRLTLPPRGYAVTGHATAVWFDNLVLDKDANRHRFVVECDIGKTAERGWSVVPTEAEVGEHTWRVRVFDGDRAVAEGSFPWTVMRADAASGKPLRLLIVGDSLTHASVYPNDLAKRLSEPGGPKWTTLGTHRPAGAAAGVAHEGYGGWTWDRFVTHFEPKPDPAARKISSPFVFAQEGTPKLDVARYVREACGDEPPDVVFFLLGINDCFGAKPDDPKAIDATIERMFARADTLLAAFREAAPRADLALGLTTPGNARESGFEANYKGAYTRWGWKRIQHRLVERQIEKFAGREQDRIFVVPTELNVDPEDGYPVDNGVHPNSHGYSQIGASLHAWLVWRLAGK
jgi:lysophospholipase L1-like esterase